MRGGSDTHLSTLYLTRCSRTTAPHLRSSARLNHMAFPRGEPMWPTKLGAVLAASGMSVRELAAECGTDKWSINDHLHGRRRPSTDRIALYCYALGCEPEDIIEPITAPAP